MAHEHHGHHDHEHDDHSKHGHGSLPYFKGRFGLPYRPNFKILILIALALLLLFFYRRVIIIVVLLIIVIIYDFFIHFFHFPLHIDPIPFAGIFVAVGYGLPIAIIFVLIGEILPEMLVGHFEVADFFNFVPLIAVLAIFFAAPPANFTATVLIAMTCYAVLNAAIAFFSGAPFHKFAVEPPLDFIINIALLLRLAPILLFIAKT